MTLRGHPGARRRGAAGRHGLRQERQLHLPAGAGLLNAVVVVGAGLAGVRAAAELRAQGYQGRLTLLGAETGPAVRPAAAVQAGAAGRRRVGPDRPGLAGRRRPAHRRDGRPRSGRARSPTTAGDERWDGLVLAVGAVPRRLAGSDGGAYVLRTAADAYRLRSALVPGAHGRRGRRRLDRRRGGHRGRAPGLRGHRAGGRRRPAGDRARSGRGRSRTRHWYAEAGRDPAHRRGRLHASTRRGVGLAGEGRVEADVVVEAVGVRPRLDWLAGSGVEVDPASGGVVVDEAARSTLPGVVAVGDCAARWSPRADRRVRTEHWDDALHAPDGRGRDACSARPRSTTRSRTSGPSSSAATCSGSAGGPTAHRSGVATRPAGPAGPRPGSTPAAG